MSHGTGMNRSASIAALHELEPAGGWLGPARPRIATPALAESGWLFRGAAAARRLFGREQLPDIFTVFNINRRLFWPWLLFASRLMPFGALPPRDRERLILRTAWNCRSRYEWGQHVDIGLAAGLGHEDILRVARGPDACTSTDERLLLLACDEICTERCISDGTWRALALRHDEKTLIEITVLVGHYLMVAAFLLSTGLQLEPAMEDALALFNGASAGPGAAG